MNWIVWTLVGSALLRLVSVFVAFEVAAKLSKSDNYPNTHWTIPAGLRLVGAILAANIADLCERAMHTWPPQPLLSGYALTVGILILGAIGHYMIQKAWLPAAVRKTMEQRIAPWQGIGPCIRATKTRRDRERLARVSRTVNVEKPNSELYALATAGEPVYTDVASVIPDNIRSMS